MSHSGIAVEGTNFCGSQRFGVGQPRWEATTSLLLEAGLCPSGKTNIFDSLDISEGTKQDYLARLPRFFEFMNRNDVSRNLLLNYKQALRDDASLGVASMNKYLTTARIALREMYRIGMLSQDLSVGVKSFKQSAKHKVTGLDEQEVEKICQHLQSLDDSFVNVRLRAIVALLLFQGLRQIEICRLDVSDVSLIDKRLYVIGKGRDDREPIHIHPETLKVLTEYLRGSKAKHGPLFTHINRQTSGNRLTTRGLRQIFQNLLKELEIERTTHGTRHWFTTELIRHYKSDLTTVAKFTRHSSLEMLMIYNDEILDEGRAEELAEVFDYRLNASI